MPGRCCRTWWISRSSAGEQDLLEVTAVNYPGRSSETLLQTTLVESHNLSSRPLADGSVRLDDPNGGYRFGQPDELECGESVGPERQSCPCLRKSGRLFDYLNADPSPIKSNRGSQSCDPGSDYQNIQIL